MGWLLDKRIEWAEDALADAKHDQSVWGDHFGISPSQKKAMRRKIERKQEKLDRLKAKRGDHANDEG